MKLYELTENYKNLEDVLETIDEDNQELIFNALNEVGEQLNGKVENIIKFIRNLEGDIQALKTEEQRLQKTRRRKEKQVKSLENYLFNCISSLDSKEVKGDIFTASIKKNPVSVSIIDLNTIPTEYIVNNPTANKKAIKEALKNGEIIEGAILEQKESLKIK